MNTFILNLTFFVHPCKLKSARTYDLKVMIESERGPKAKKMHKGKNTLAYHSCS